MRRVLVIGSPGAGKSTFAAKLAARTGLPLIHLDQHYWRPGWREPEKAEWQEKVRELAGREAWVMDGNYGGTLALRLERADTVILLDFPAWLCLARVLRRVITSRGRVRSDMGEGCPERFDLAFFAYIARFRQGPARRNERKLQRFDGSIIRFRRPPEAERFLARSQPSGGSD